jgi:PAS domain S-box-containing protein
MSESRSETVLIVEDDPGVAYLEGLHLRRRGYEVLTSESADDALHIVEQGGVDLIVLDQILNGDVRGLDLYDQMKARGHDLPAVLVTGLSDEATLVRAIRAGVRDFVPKAPNDFDDFTSAIERVFDQVRTERRLAESEARLAGIVLLAEAIPQIVWSTDADGGMDYFNRRWVESTGMPLEKSIGWGWHEALHPADRPRVTERWREALQSGAPYEIEYRIRSASGDYRWHLVRGLPLHDNRGQIEKWFGTCTDIDDRKRSEEELRHAKDAAETASRAKDRFMATLSHELRTPLTPVLVSVSAMLQDPDTPAEIRPTLEVTRRNVELEARLIDDLLDITRISQGKLRLNRSVVDGHGLVRQALEICRDEIAGAGLVVHLDLAAVRHHVDADPARFQQIVWNLIKNAAKFTPRAGTISIRTGNGPAAAERDGPCELFVEVSDTGIGIEPSVLSTIFNAFEQGEPSVIQRFGGLGLGLTISRSLAEAHDGRLTASSEGRGSGATFQFWLPTVAPQVEAGPGTIASTPAPVAAKAIHVLLVEDNLDTLRVLSRLLRRAGFHVSTADTLTAALSLAAQEQFDVVVSDIGLPDGSGLDLMRRIRETHGANVAGIALSGYGMDEDLARSFDAGFISHLIKPIDFATFEAEVRKVVAAKAR